MAKEPKIALSQEILGKNIKLNREKAGLTQESLAEKLDISVQHLSNIERGRRFVTSDLLDRIAVTFNISFSDLFLNKELNKTTQQKNQIKRISAIIDTELSTFHDTIKKRIIDSL